MRGAAALLLALAGATAADDPFAGIPNLRFVYNPIGGASAGALAASLEASALHPPQGGSSYAQTRWGISWRWKGGGRPCRVRTADVRFEAEVHLLRLAADVEALEPALAARWQGFDAAIRLHEAGHARLAYGYLPTVRRAILVAGCDDADAAGKRALAALDARQADYDRETRFGAAQGARFP